ncbi:hypothetical protein [Amycolatopsis sp. H20-H5]|nr:hypothetical protein [Amycolatopsis sp. H20-H5]MEC3976254.1 hypothetical protein [Amycolatopsis sp. H20-H5]
MREQFVATPRTLCSRELGVCIEGCYKHYVNGKWVCCKCGH